MNVLLVEDDAETADYICKSLQDAGHAIEHVADGKQGLIAALDGEFDVIVVDRMLPGLDGLTLVKSLRGAQVSTPVLFLSAMDGINDRVDGLEAGADDYLIKPFAFQELFARLTALNRRPPMQAEETVLQVADLEMSLLQREVRRGGIRIDLQPREFRLLEYMMRNMNRVLTRSMLLAEIWDFHFDPKTNVVETQISRLRNKVDKPFDKDLIHTVRGAGYTIHD
jgi:DNA-binding response OmpR family regulator